jgi:hypothetical protein
VRTLVERDATRSAASARAARAVPYQDEGVSSQEDKTLVRRWCEEALNGANLAVADHRGRWPEASG